MFLSLPAPVPSCTARARPGSRVVGKQRARRQQRMFIPVPLFSIRQPTKPSQPASQQQFQVVAKVYPYCCSVFRHRCGRRARAANSIKPLKTVVPNFHGFLPCHCARKENVDSQGKIARFPPGYMGQPAGQRQQPSNSQCRPTPWIFAIGSKYGIATF
ncbi:hypothetical protein B0T17DRAFT_502433 [Bombardia bombarda]|uniref:Uncharacterized protein n=1 Tax=Bombardia bombarda TaxID=252184 RepID=A0AA39XJL7_9PEZI|nr:hypothetical protein B0T17DRAFT_502433 [Bombardia bombarda]